MDNLSTIEEYTALNGLGDVPAYLPEEEDLSAPAVARRTPVYAASGSTPGWLRAGIIGAGGSSPAPSLYTWSPRPGTQELVGAPEHYEDPGSVSLGLSTRAAAQNIVADPASALSPQAGTVGVDPRKLSIADVIKTLLGVTAAGVTEVQRQKLAATLIMAQKKKQPVYLPPQVVQKSQVPVGLLVGAGALVAVGVVLYFALRKKS